MKGMTGYGRARLIAKDVQIEAIISSYNKKSLDINVRIPTALSELESWIRKTITGQFERGAVTLSLRVDIRASDEENPVLSVAKTRYDTIKSVITHLGLKVSDADILNACIRESALFTQEGLLSNNDHVISSAQTAIEQALSDLQKARLNEGEALVKEFTARLQTISEIRATIDEKKGNCLDVHVQKLRSLIDKYMSNLSLTDERLLKEIVIFADKLDISEELQRIGHHIDYFKTCMREKNALGKKLDFLLQELMREFNTIGSKTDLVDISHAVVLAKTEIEKMREQIQNVE